jgi:LPXTG-site transpeptidase (sortase) family protein
MSEKPLLLSPAKSGILLMPSREARLRLFAAVAGVIVILVGAADLTTRAAHALLGDQAGAVAFGPAISLVDPSLLGASGVGQVASTELIPARLRIPSIGVDAPVEQVSAKSDGTMGTPTKFGDVAWYAPGQKPGAEGNAVFAGHVDNALTTAGVFEHLSSLKKGDYITVADEAGKTLVYRVVSSQSYAANEAPVAQIFAKSGPSQLVLITCAGDWVTSEHQFDQRLVVVAAPAY